MTEIVDPILLVIGFLFTFLIPGLYIVETFFPQIPKRFKLPLYFILSVMISVYFVSLFIGFSRYSIIVLFSFFIPWIFINFTKTIKELFKTIKIHKYAFIFSILVYLIYLVSLYPGIFTLHNGFIVMSSSNWQDTAMHAGIIETISQGNFPPQAPYFSGVPLNYYYFTDFHSSIIETLYGHFFPRVIVYDNPLFVTLFFLSVYLLTFEITRRKIIAIFSALTSTFYGSFMYINFIKDFIKSNNANIFTRASELLTNNSYAIEFGKFFQISPMADYFLQNRPMMVGLPAVIVVFVLVRYALEKKDYKFIFLSGVITAMLVKFQFFAFLISIFIFIILSIMKLKIYGIKKLVKTSLLFLIAPICFVLLFTSTSTINNSSLINVVLNNFKLVPWEENKSLIWYLSFLISNLGLPIVLFVISIPILFIKKRISKKEWARIAPMYLIGSILAVIPLVFRFTIMKYDMLKFYYFVEIFVSIISFWFIYKLIKNKIVAVVVSVFLLLLTVPTSLTNLANSYLNKTMAYTQSDLDVGYWIRENTKQKSVFIDLANLHSPISEIGGRLRVLSYINWPHSHGYNVGVDNVFTRLDDIRNVYKNGDNHDMYQDVLNKYKVDYIYCGNEERREFSNSCELLKKSKTLIKVYDNKNILLFKVI